MATPSPDVPDIIGFGALNLDYVEGISNLSEREVDAAEESHARFEWGAEHTVDEATVRSAIERIGLSSLEPSLGGSAWLTMYSLAQMRLDIRIGYVGYIGRVERPGLSFTNEMIARSIDHRLVAKDTTIACGICLSHIEDGDRVMLTYPGANARLADHIKVHFESIAQYFAQARLVHVTSFLDEATPEYAYRVLARAKELNAAMQLSFDPGCAWCQDPSESVKGILHLADYLFVNYREFKSLGRHSPGETDQTVASRIYEFCHNGCMILVPKRYDVVEVFEKKTTTTSSSLAVSRFIERPLQAGSKIEDATGVGDTFAAGLLAALLSRRLQVEFGAYLGMSLARHKLQSKHMRGSFRFPDLTKGFLQYRESTDAQRSLPSDVFLAHGHDSRWRDNSQWHSLHRFLQGECLGSISVMGDSSPDEDATGALTEVLGRCSFAVCLLTADDAMPTGDSHPDQAVIHQAGLFHGRYGFSRVAILVEEGVQTFSNVAGLVTLQFGRGEIARTFWLLQRMLRREGLSRDGLISADQDW